MLATTSSGVRDSANGIVDPNVEAAEAKQLLDLKMANIGVDYNPDIPGIWMMDEERPMKFGKGYFCPNCSGPGAAKSLSDTLTPQLGWIRHGLVGR
jgi:hypothetical protein